MKMGDERFSVQCTEWCTGTTDFLDVGNGYHVDIDVYN